MPVRSEALPIYRFGKFELDPRSAELRKNGARLKIQEQPLQVLLKLLEHPGEVVSREELRASVWPADTFVDFETGLNTVIKRLRETLGDSAETPIFIETIPRRGYRFVATVETHPRGLAPGLVPDKVPPRSRPRHKVWLVSLAVALLAGLLAAFFWEHRRPQPLLASQGIMVVADFTNSTGDPVFDDTLKQAVTIGLQQSPHVRILPEQRIKETLALMGRPAGEPLKQDLAREVCQRSGGAALLTGSISSLGSEYVIGLKVLNCENGEMLALEQAQAPKKEDVLKTLGTMATRLRSTLGESLRSVERFDAPIEQATTPSLDAFKAYTLGMRALYAKSPVAAIPFFNRATELDPNFALAYSLLGTVYGDVLLESELAAENARKAYELRDRVSERERFKNVTGDLEKAIQTYESWSQTYPEDAGVHNLIGVLYGYSGQYDKAATEILEAIRLFSDAAINYSNLMEDYTALNRLDQAKSVYRQALDRQLEGVFLHDDRYAIAFLEGDSEEMKRQVAWAAGKPGEEDILLSADSDTEAFYGHLERSRRLSQRAVDSSKRAGLKETAALWKLNLALREAEFGNSERARQAARTGLSIASTRNARTIAALALARAGDLEQAEKMAADLEKQNPSNTAITRYWLPTIRAYVAIGQNDGARALQFLEVATPYDLAFPPPQFGEGGLLYPAYVRGQAYLLLHSGKEAAREFQKLIDHRGIVINSPLGTLAYLGLARAFALEGDSMKARDAYQHLFGLWKDSDSDILLLQQAKMEYAKLG